MCIENYIHIYLAELKLLNDKHIKRYTLGFPFILNLPLRPVCGARCERCS